jgi:FAD/FMN-containing dehydrogenase
MPRNQPVPIDGKNSHQSWGRYPRVQDSQVVELHWRDEIPPLKTYTNSVLPYGYGRSYGDSCLNGNGILLDMHALNRFLLFDEARGLLRCEAGVSLAHILALTVPRGWFISVSPGTKYVSVGGAIANDVHGKNHHSAGTFGCHVTQFELLRSDGDRMVCSPAQNSEMFKATIGGLGLTGLILWAEIQLKKIDTPFMAVEAIRFESFDEFWELDAESSDRYKYIVSWLDCFTHAGRGHFFRGNNATPEQAGNRKPHERVKFRIPFDLPSVLLNDLTVRMCSEVVYRSQVPKRIEGIQHYEPFYYPLDTILDWNRAYGRSGFLQYQFVVPGADNCRDLKEILAEIRKSGVLVSFVNVFKRFGDAKSPGMLSFPRPGVTFAVDIPFRGKVTLKLLDRLDDIVRFYDGAVYPAKDARMSASNFQAFYPNWTAFSKYIDPQFSSSFWRRVTGTNAG